MKMHYWVTFVHFLVAIALGSIGTTALPAPEYVRDSEPKVFSYDELVQLGSDHEMSPELVEKLRLVTTTPFINNEAYLSGVRPRPLDVPRLGPSLRVAFWNIERGLELDYIELFLSDKDAFMAKIEEERKQAKENKKNIRAVQLEDIPQEIEILKSADVFADG
jgi:hypothetical protein